MENANVILVILEKIVRRDMYNMATVMKMIALVKKDGLACYAIFHLVQIIVVIREYVKMVNVSVHQDLLEITVR
jgi:hypothetical protein